MLSGERLLDELNDLCKIGDILSASKKLHEVYKDPNTHPSEWFDIETDSLLPRLVVTLITTLEATPLSSWAESDYFFLSRLMVLGCGGAMMEDGDESNSVANRWLGIFYESLVLLTPDEYPLLVWLLTLETPHDTLLKPALGISDRRLHGLGTGWWKRSRGRRNRSLCRFKGRLLDAGVECGTDFHKRLKATGDCNHFCFDCVLWPLRVAVASSRGWLSRSHATSSPDHQISNTLPRAGTYLKDLKIG